VDLRTRTSLFCGVLALAIAVSVLLRGRVRRTQILFTAFAADIGLWYLAQWLYHVMRSDLWARFTAVLPLFLPLLALHLFEAVVPSPERRSPLIRIAGVLMVPLLVLVLLPLHLHGWVRPWVFSYVVGLLLAGLWSLARRGKRSRSRATKPRVRLLVWIGALAVGFTLADFLWFIGAPLPPVGAVLSVVFLFALSESVVRQRLLDLYDVLGQLLVSTALAFALAGIFYAFVALFGGFEQAYLGAILAAIVILVLLEPLRNKVETYTHRAFFRERVDLERAVAEARGALVTILEVEEMTQAVMTTLEGSRRTTGAALYLLGPSGSSFHLAFGYGPEAPPRIDGAAARPLIERLESYPSVSLEQVAYEVEELKSVGGSRLAEAEERLLATARVLGPYKESLCLGIHGESGLLGLLMLIDDRVKDAFSPEEVALLESLAVQIGVVAENSRQYRRMKERDRLTALGQMAAGLAHEVRNPLGAIKGAAQLLNEPVPGAVTDPSTHEFVSIILEEVERLDGVVGSVLDYARPSKANLGSVDVNGVVHRTLQILETDLAHECTVETRFSEGLPLVRADAERLRQVLMNLVRNAIQAMNGHGRVTVYTRAQLGRPPGAAWGDPALVQWVEVAVRDRGPGITRQVQNNLFVPFFTTKDTGTGLGLAISQRMIEDMGGRIEVVSQPGQGATFTVVLPAGSDTPFPHGVGSPPPESRETQRDRPEGLEAPERIPAS
jgi:two-component system sensor histidine kinase HydH